MKPIVLQPTGIGAPCNGCGQCCREELCGLAVDVLDDIDAPAIQGAPCPFLREHDDRFWCGVIEHATRLDVAFGAHLAWRLGIGAGCLMEKPHPESRR